MKFKKFLATILTAIAITNNSYAQENEQELPPLYEVAEQVKKQREQERIKEMFERLTPDKEYFEKNLARPQEKPPLDPTEFIFKNLLLVFGISADSSLSNSAVRQLRRKLISEAENGRNFYANQIELQITETNYSPNPENNFKEIKKIEYNYLSSFGLTFTPFKNTILTTKLVGSFDPFKVKASPKIKTELLIKDHIELYAEIWKTYTKHETKPYEWEIGININILRLIDYLKSKNL